MKESELHGYRFRLGTVHLNPFSSCASSPARQVYLDPVLKPFTVENKSKGQIKSTLFHLLKKSLFQFGLFKTVIYSVAANT